MAQGARGPGPGGGPAKHVKPLAAAVVVFTLWGFSFLASTVGQAAASPLVVLMYRFDIASLVMLTMGFFMRPRPRLVGRNLRPLILLGLCEPVVYFIGEQYGLKYANSAFSGVMIAVIPVVTLVMAAAFLKERPTRAQWLFSLLSIAGVVWITILSGGEGQVRPLGVALLSLAVITGSAYSVISRGISAEFTAYERSLVMQLMGAVFFTLLAAWENRADPARLAAPLSDGGFVLSILYLSLGASVAGYLLFNYAVSAAPMASVMSLGNLTTVISVAAGVLILGEPFSPAAAAALAVILMGIWGVQRSGAGARP